VSEIKDAGQLSTQQQHGACYFDQPYLPAELAMIVRCDNDQLLDLMAAWCLTGDNTKPMHTFLENIANISRLQAPVPYKL
jgi:hypothetical protein